MNNLVSLDLYNNTSVLKECDTAFVGKIDDVKYMVVNQFSLNCTNYSKIYAEYTFDHSRFKPNNVSDITYTQDPDPSLVLYPWNVCVTIQKPNNTMSYSTYVSYDENGPTPVTMNRLIDEDAILYNSFFVSNNISRLCSSIDNAFKRIMNKAALNASIRFIKLGEHYAILVQKMPDVTFSIYFNAPFLETFNFDTKFDGQIYINTMQLSTMNDTNYYVTSTINKPNLFPFAYVVLMANGLNHVEIRDNSNQDNYTNDLQTVYKLKIRSSDVDNIVMNDTEKLRNDTICLKFSSIYNFTISTFLKTARTGRLYKIRLRKGESQNCMLSFF